MSQTADSESTTEVVQCGQIDSVIGILDSRVDFRVRTSWPREEWKERGVDLKFFQCDETLLPGTNPEVEFPDLVTRFKTIAHLRKALKLHDPEKTFIIFFFHKYGVADYALFRAVDRAGFKYAFLLSDEGDLPSPDFSNFEQSFFRELEGKPFYWRLRHLVKVSLMRAWRGFTPFIRIPNDLRYHANALRYFADRTLGRIFKDRSLLRGPEFWVGKGQGSIDHYYPWAFPVGKRTRICWTHLFLYDRYLGFRGRLKNEPIALYLGQNAPFYSHSGYRNVIEARDYYARLTELFQYVEKHLRLRIVKTTHPWGEPERINEWIKPYVISEGDSIAAVAEANFVMGHCSTALYYAVLFHKPAIFFTTDQLESMGDYGPYTRTMAKQLGKTPINLDRVPLDNIDWEAERAIDEGKYAAFKNYYIKRPGTPELPSWDIIWNAIHDAKESSPGRVESD
ncbi:MAG: hypothetical protein RIF32_04840 [Leptospirales bacterium]|jgi:hypothetical protein